MSARKRDGLDLLVRKIVDVLPTGRALLSPRTSTPISRMRFMVAELIRESILIETGEEVPYASAVVIEQFEEPEPEPPRKKGAAPRAAADTHRRRHLLRARRAEGDPDRQGRIEAEGDRHRSARARSSRCWARASISNCTSSSSRAGASRVAFIESLDWRRQIEKLGGKEES